MYELIISVVCTSANRKCQILHICVGVREEMLKKKAQLDTNNRWLMLFFETASDLIGLGMRWDDWEVTKGNNSRLKEKLIRQSKSPPRLTFCSDQYFIHMNYERIFHFPTFPLLPLVFWKGRRFKTLCNHPTSYLFPIFKESVKRLHGLETQMNLWSTQEERRGGEGRGGGRTGADNWGGDRSK